MLRFLKPEPQQIRFASSYLKLTPIFSTEIALVLYLSSSPGVKYSLAVHDPQFYWQTYNGLTIPKAALSLEIGTDTYLWVAATVYEELDRTDARCEKDRDYSFTACVRVRRGIAPACTDCLSSLCRQASTGSLGVGLLGIIGRRPPYLYVQMSASCWTMKNY